MHAIIDYTLPALFSWRTLTANAFAARTLPCPAPAGVKLALLSTLLRRDGGEGGQEHLDWLAPLGIAWAPPQVMSVTAATVRVWKSDQPNQLLGMSVGMREYLHAADAMGLAILDVPDSRREDAAYALDALRALGNAESLVQPLARTRWVDTLPDGFVMLTREEQQPGNVAVLLDDLGTAPAFDRLSVYRDPGGDAIPRLGEDRRRLLVQLPLRVTRRTADSYTLDRVP